MLERVRINQCNIFANNITNIFLATIPQEKDGIQIPPDITSAPEPRNENSTSMSTEDAYKKYVDIIVSESLRLTASVDVSTPLKLNLDFRLDKSNSTTFVYLCKSRAMVSQTPGFLFSSYRQTAYFSPAIVSMDQYYRLMKETYDAAPPGSRTEELPVVPPKDKLLVKLKPNLPIEEREVIINGIRNFIDNDLTQLIDTTDIVGSTKMALDLLTLFFNISKIPLFSLVYHLRSIHNCSNLMLFCALVVIHSKCQ